jgi:hypothetical protein
MNSRVGVIAHDFDVAGETVGEYTHPTNIQFSADRADGN